MQHLLEIKFYKIYFKYNKNTICAVNIMLHVCKYLLNYFVNILCMVCKMIFNNFIYSSFIK